MRPAKSFDEVLEAIEHLPPDEQADLVEVVRLRLAERGRRQIIEEVRLGRAEFADGKTKPADLDDLMREIDG